jgi:DNA topoisomerase-1
MYRERTKAYREALVSLRREAREKRKLAKPAKREAVRLRYEKRLGVAERRLEKALELLEKSRLAQGKIKSQSSIAYKKRTWNLGTSLKSYIDPRVYYEWGTRVDYDVLEKYYPKALRLKFAWVREDAADEKDTSAPGQAPGDRQPSPADLSDGPGRDTAPDHQRQGDTT